MESRQLLPSWQSAQAWALLANSPLLLPLFLLFLLPLRPLLPVHAPVLPARTIFYCRLALCGGRSTTEATWCACDLCGTAAGRAGKMRGNLACVFVLKTTAMIT